MNCDATTKRYTIKVPKDNSFTLILPLKQRTYVSNVPIDTPIVYSDLEDVILTVGGVEYATTQELDGVHVQFPDGIAEGVSDIILTATYRGAQIRAAYFEALTGVDWQYQSAVQQFIQGSPIMADAAFVIGGPLTDSELEELKAEYRDKIADAEAAEEAAEAAKDAYDEKAEMLDDVAQETTLVQGVQDIREDISHIDIDTTTLAKEATLGSSPEPAVGSTIFSWLKNIRDFLVGIVTTNPYAKEANATENKKKIMGADSQATWDTGVSIPAASFDSGSFNCIVRDDDKYWLDYNEHVGGSDAIIVGDICRASELDATNGYKICTNYVSPFALFGNVAKSGDDYYLLYGDGTAFTAIEANKNYRCKEIVNLAYQPKPLQPSSTITGYLYIWEEYEGESIKDGVEEIKDAINAIDLSGVAQQGTNASATLTSTQAAVVDGNDTAVSVGKEIRSEVGTGSDTAAESGTLFAVLKWVKDKVKSIGTDYAKQGSNANANISDIQALIGYTISEIDGI